jgi:hypothetical protein
MVVNDYELEKPWFLSSGPPNKWQYESLTIPPDYITGNDKITLKVMQMENPHLNLYHLWFYQPIEDFTVFVADAPKLWRRSEAKKLIMEDDGDSSHRTSLIHSLRITGSGTLLVDFTV